MSTATMTATDTATDTSTATLANDVNIVCCDAVPLRPATHKKQQHRRLWKRLSKRVIPSSRRQPAPQGDVDSDQDQTSLRSGSETSLVVDDTTTATTTSTTTRPKKSSLKVKTLAESLQQSTCIRPASEIKVQFANVETRIYTLVLSDHPCCLQGPPIGLGWRVVETHQETVNHFQKHSRSNPFRPQTNVLELHLPVSMRERWLLQRGYAPQHMRQAEQDAKDIRAMRQRSSGDIAGLPQWLQPVVSIMGMTKTTRITTNKKSRSKLSLLTTLTTTTTVVVGGGTVTSTSTSTSTTTAPTTTSQTTRQGRRASRTLRSRNRRPRRHTYPEINNDVAISA